MAAKTIELEFDGYWREPAFKNIPSHSGVYCVLACIHNKEKSTVDIKKLVYIGEAKDVNDRLTRGHEKLNEWKAKCADGEVICVSAAQVSSTDRERAEAALIYLNKPPVNESLKDSFSFDDTTVKVSGRAKLLNDGTAKKTT